MTLQKISRFFSNVSACHSSLCVPGTEARPFHPRARQNRGAPPGYRRLLPVPCSCSWEGLHSVVQSTRGWCRLQLCSQICRARASARELLLLVCETLCVGIRCDGEQRGAHPAAGPGGRSPGTPPWVTLMPRFLAGLTRFPSGSPLPLSALMTSIPLSFCVWCGRTVLFSVAIQRQLPFSRGNLLFLMHSSALLVWLLHLSVGASWRLFFHICHTFAQSV